MTWDGEAFSREHGPVTSELLVRLATLLNDFNPAHYDLDFADEIGMPGVIGPGTLLQGWILADIEAVVDAPDVATGEPHRVRALDLRFRAPFLVGDTVTMDYVPDGDALRVEVRAWAGDSEPRVVALATRAPGTAGKERFVSNRVPLRRVVGEIAGALGQAESAVLGVPVAIDLRWRRDERGLFMSGVPADLLDQIGETFAATFDLGAGAAGAADSESGVGSGAGRWVSEWWSTPTGRGIGTGPALVRGDRGDGAAITAQAVDRDETSKLEQAQALRTQFAGTAARLECPLAEPIEAGVLLAALDSEPVDTVAVLDDIADSRRLVGRYLLDAADDYDDERVDQLGDGYVRVAELWAGLTAKPDPDIVKRVIELERTCLQWMLGAAAPPTRYAF